MTAGGGGAPAVTMRRGWLNFTPLAAQYWASELTTTGAPQRWVTPSDSIRRTASRGIGLAQADVTAAGSGHGPGETPAVAVEQGERPEVDAALGQLVLGDFADGVDPGAAVGEHHAFGEARGAGSVVDGDAGVLVDDRNRRGAGPSLTQESLVVVDDVGHGRIGDQGLKLGVHQQDFGAAVAQDPLQFGGGEAGVQHHQDGADPHGGEVGLQRHGAVGGEDCHPVAGLHAELQEGGRLTFHASAELRVGEAAVAFDDGGKVAPGVDAASQKVERSKRRDHAAIVYHQGIMRKPNSGVPPAVPVQQALFSRGAATYNQRG